MRVFGGDKALGMVKSLGLPEDEAIYNPFVSRALESAQKRIEGFHFDARKSVLEYDTVLNKQRETVYSKRRSILFATGGYYGCVGTRCIRYY
jgi:preprotein translocase subunit SecA